MRLSVTKQQSSSLGGIFHETQGCIVFLLHAISFKSNPSLPPNVLDFNWHTWMDIEILSVLSSHIFKHLHKEIIMKLVLWIAHM